MPSCISFTAPRKDFGEIQQEINAMSAEERDAALRDVYGTQDESLSLSDDDFLTRKLEEMDRLLNSVATTTPGDAEAFSTAQRLIPAFVNDRDFRLLFLRSEQFDAKLAANRMIHYWKNKVRLFGTELAYQPRHIRLSDLSDDDKASLNAMALYLLPHTDMAGRAILASTRQKYVFAERENIGRLLWYLLHVGLETAGAQQRGFVSLLMDDGHFSISEHYDRRLDRLMTDVGIRSLPVWLAGIHHYMNNRMVEILGPFLLYLMGSRARARYRLYTATSRRLESLAACGITKDMVPTTIGGTYEFDPQEWQRQRTTLEEQRE